MTKIYVVETVLDALITQCGFSLDKSRAEFEAREFNKHYGDEYWVTEYTLDKPSDFCEFN